MIPYRKPYVESSVFIAFIKGEMRENEHDCKKIFQAILDAASQENFMIYTSSLTIAEVCKKRGSQDLSSDEIVDLRPHFRDSCIRIVEVDREIGEEANQLCQTSLAQLNNTPKLRPNDAIHLACAERAGCDYLLTYDGQLTGQTRNNLIIEWPREFSEGNLRVAVASGSVQPALPFTDSPMLLQAPSIEDKDTDKARHEK